MRKTIKRLYRNIRNKVKPRLQDDEIVSIQFIPYSEFAMLYEGAHVIWSSNNTFIRELDKDDNDDDTRLYYIHYNDNYIVKIRLKKSDMYKALKLSDEGKKSNIANIIDTTKARVKIYINSHKVLLSKSYLGCLSCMGEYDAYVLVINLDGIDIGIEGIVLMT